MKTWLRSESLQNIIWLIFDKVLLMVLHFFIGVKIANYYGPTTFGMFNYIGAIVAFSGLFFELINPRVIKTFYTEENYQTVVHNATVFRTVIAVALFVLSVGSIAVIDMEWTAYLVLVLLALDNIFTTSTMGIENYFEYKLEVKKTVLTNNLVKILSYAMQYMGIILQYSIVMVPLVRCICTAIRMVILQYIYRREYSRKGERPHVDISLMQSIVRDSVYLWISFAAFLLYTQLDRIMLGSMLGTTEVGVYSIALQLVAVPMIILTPIPNILFSKMIALYKKDYKAYIAYYFKMNYAVTQLFIIILAASIIVVQWAFPYVFTAEYNGAVAAYTVLTITVLLKANGAFQTGHMTLKHITKKSIYKTGCGLVINTVLNYVLIREYGMIGAAWATSITQIFTLLIIDFFIKEYREQAWIQLKSFNPFYGIGLLKARR